jgi:hypothetical protein
MTLLQKLQHANGDTLSLSSAHPRPSTVTAESLNRQPNP